MIMSAHTLLCAGSGRSAESGVEAAFPMDCASRDCHAHLQEYSCEELPAVMERARSAGIRRVDCCSEGPWDWDAISGICAGYPEAVPGYGVHPWYAGRAEAEFRGWEQVLREKLSCRPDAFVGEAGLDARRGDVSVQRGVLDRQLRIAADLGRAVNLHCAGAWGKLFDAVSPYAPKLGGVVLHSPSMSAEMAERFLKLGAVFSFGRRLLCPASLKIRELIRKIPEGSVFFESDMPSGPEYGPWTVVCLAERAAELRGRRG